MASTPTRTPGRKARANPAPSPKASPGPCPYKGASVTVPGEIFREPVEAYTGTVKGWNGRRTDSLTVRFDDDGSQYWFPLSDVLNWMDNKAADAEPPTPFSPGLDSPGSNSKGTTLRQRTRASGGASSKSQTPAEQQAAATREAQSGSQQQQQETGRLLQVQQAACSWLHRVLTYRNIGILCGLVLLSIVVLAAMTAGKGAPHNLAVCRDRLLSVYHEVTEKLAAGLRHSHRVEHQTQEPAEVVVTTIVQEAVVPQDPAVGREVPPVLQ